VELGHFITVVGYAGIPLVDYDQNQINPNQMNQMSQMIQMNQIIE
jgi:hypothetical protein